MDEEGEDEENTFCGSNGSTMDIIQLYNNSACCIQHNTYMHVILRNVYYT